jgi:hypothetical protein
MISREQLPEALYSCVLEIINMRRKRMNNEPLENLGDIPPATVNMVVEEILVANQHYAAVTGLEFIPVLKSS